MLKTEFTPKIRNIIKERDENSCIFCRCGYHMEKATDYGLMIKSIMHYIPRSHGGLGIAENGAIGCQYHHEMLDNGKDGRREEMLGIFREYLESHYPEWSENRLKYSKWKFLEL